MSSSNRTRLTRFEPTPPDRLPRETRPLVRVRRLESCRETPPTYRHLPSSRATCEPEHAFRRTPACHYESRDRSELSYEGQPSQFLRESIRKPSQYRNRIDRLLRVVAERQDP